MRKSRPKNMGTSSRLHSSSSSNTSVVAGKIRELSKKDRSTKCGGVPSHRPPMATLCSTLFLLTCVIFILLHNAERILARQQVDNPPPAPVISSQNSAGEKSAQQQINQPPPVAGAQQQPGSAVGIDVRLAQKPECRFDLENHCAKQVAQLPPGEVLSDAAALECLQEAGFSEGTSLQEGCAQAVWDYKVAMTQDTRFVQGIQQFCAEEMAKSGNIQQCTTESNPGHALSCMMEKAKEIQQASRCFQFLVRAERIAFSDFRLVSPFVESCQTIISALNCGQLTKMSAHQRARLPHSQGSTLECLIEKMVNPPRDPEKLKIVQGITPECRHQVMRIAELQSDDFHLDRDLYFACRVDREQFCSEVQAGQGKVFQCLMQHKEDKFMNPQCAKIVSERAGLMGQDYRLAHPLTKACANEMTSYRCVPQPGFEKSLQFHLSWVLLCLENGLHHYNRMLHDKQQGQKVVEPALQAFNDECQHEMVTHRQMMVEEFRMSPELVMSCAQEIDRYCSPKGDLEGEGKTIHCLMGHAESRDEKDAVFGQQCKNALQDLVKVADIGSNYKVDKVLYASCRALIEGSCQRDAQSEASTLTCLMKNLDGPEMTDDCEQRLVEVQYFMARDWAMDPQLYEACHAEAVSRCSAVDNWYAGAGNQENKDMRVDPGPQVLACLYRSGYDEERPLSADCANNIHRVLRERAARVNLLPDVEENCRGALSEYCSHNVQPEEEMKCLQEHFESKEFKERYGKCQEELSRFTAMEAKDTQLNHLLTRACKPVITTYCSEFANMEIDHGDVMECLAAHKDTEEMTSKCRTYVNHFELVSLRDYHFSYRFKEACSQDIDRYCNAFGQDKGAIIRCLSNIMFEHRILNKAEDLNKECKKQLKAQYLQQEKASFDDKEHMGDADPELMRKCDRDVRRLNCLDSKDRSSFNFEDVVECLRVEFDTLDPDCKSMIFSREKIEALDNEFDDELQKSCKYDIAKFCGEQKGDKVLDCLMNTKIVRLLQRGCQVVVQERMLERTKDDRLNPALLEACRDDAQQYCPEDYRKINEPQYAKQQLGGIIAYCLRNKFSQFNGGIALSPGCKDRVSEVILESEFDIHLDPGLYKACKRTINDRCSTTILAKGGHFDNVLECLKSEFYQGLISSDDCNKQMSRRAQESLVDIHLDPGLHEACGGDIQRFCRDVVPGQSRVVMCLMDAMDVKHAQLSDQCRNKLSEREKLWRVAHDKYMMSLPENWSQAYRLISEHPARNWILTYAGLLLLLLLLLGCCCGRFSKRQHTELKNR